MQISMTTQRRAVGTFGFVAIAAILTVAMVSANFTAQVQADHEPAQAAKKAGVSMNNPTAAVSGSHASGELLQVIDELGHFDIKSNNNGDWLVDATIECATATNVKATGKQSEKTGAFAGAKVWYTFNGKPISVLTGDRYEDWTEGDPIPEDATWNLCEQVVELKSNFNDLITACTAEQELAGECTEGEVIFVCETQTSIDENNDECSQSLEMFTKVAGTHPATVMIHDVPGGESHTVALNAILSHGGSSESTLYSTNPDADSLNYVDAGVILGKRVIVAEPVHMQTIATGN